jgi:trehalose synthase
MDVFEGRCVKKRGSTSNPLWYKDAILYEVHVRSFADSNADGIGDFAGLEGRLDYLQELGVTCLWLLPFFPSPLRDDGYDIADYKAVNPSYGTLDDFQRFVDAAHLRGMQVLIELVMNHSSDQHPWFERARLAPAGSVERDFYVWSDSNARFPGVRIIFNDTETSNWTWDPVAGAYYWHRFFSHQPDLNYDNPAVLEEMLDAMRFWLDRGVDGLRLDAIPYLVERDGTNCENLPETHSILRSVRAVIDAEYSNRFLLAEANQWPSDVRPYFGDGDECHMAFNFPLMPRIYVAIRQEDRQPIVDIMQQIPAIPATCQWGLFLRNHDELTLEMVTQDERDYMYLAYSTDPRARLNLGIRRRLAPLLDNNRARIELLTSLLFSFPGTPILYYGDEIGMGDNIELGDRNGVRTPMQWDASANGGFSTADAAKLFFPVISDPVYGYQAVNVEEQRENPSSLLRWMRDMIGLRKLFNVFGRGSLRFLQPANRKVLAYVREQDDASVVCVANLSRFAQPVALDLAVYEGSVPMEVFGYNAFPQITSLPYVLSLAPYSFLWLEIEGPVHAAVPEKVETAGAEAIAEPLVAVQANRAPPAVEVREPAGSQGLLVYAAPGTPEALRQLVAGLGQASAGPGLNVTLAYPLPAGGADWPQETAQAGDGRLVLAPYRPATATLPYVWPYTAPSYAELARLAEQHGARAALRLSPEFDLLPWPCILALANQVLHEGADLGIARYQLDHYTGLLNSAVLRPLTHTLYSADIAYPLSPDAAFSTALLQHLASVAPLRNGASSEELVLWPALEAVTQSLRVVQVDVGVRHFVQPSGADVTALLTRVLSSMFAEIELNAGYWQRARPLYPVRNVSGRNGAGEPVDSGHSLASHAGPPVEPLPDVSPMVASFHLAAGNLNEVWSQAMAPGTLLGIKRLAEQAPADFKMADPLWVRIVWDFLAAYRSRSVNRTHIFGAFVPLYLGWAASYVRKIAGSSDLEVEERNAALARAFDSDKPYLMARWRWPDRFTP